MRFKTLTDATGKAAYNSFLSRSPLPNEGVDNLFEDQV